MPKLQLEKAYSPQQVEQRLYREWESRGYFTAPVREGRSPYVIMMPPPNVTGRLTIGHVLNNTIQDVLIRWHRMLGEDTLWLPGMDHAGLATQVKVEAELAKEGLTRHDLGREQMIQRINDWKEHHGGIILRQLRRIGVSCDWSRERFTLDPSLSRAVLTIFVRLYEKGLVYRGKRIVNWDPVGHTALSDEQVEMRPVSSSLWHFKYPLSDGSGHLVVATTRPETMLGDTAVAIHPEDDRYRQLRGKTVRLPIVGREIPIVFDDYVDREFGTGCVKVTPAHDPNDFEIAMRHHLEFVIVIGPDGKLTNAAPAEFQGMTREAARKLVVERLQELDALEKIEPYTHAVGHNERTGTIIEPLLSEQWFVKMQSLAEPAIRSVREGRVNFHPKHWEKTFFHWMENVRDWCISRQVWYGHRIPIWTVQETGEVICAVDDPSRDPRFAGQTLVQDPDVLDTWFSSWLWTFSTLGWPEATADLQRFHPTSVLVTAPEIIFLWVARMMMASEEVFGVEPFRDVYFTGIVRDPKGRKMSKSLGNSPDPIDVIDEFGADALRFTMVSLTPHGGDIRFGAELCENGRNFANKIWNATRFLLMNLPEEGDGFEFERIDERGKLPDSLIDRWITSAFFSAVNDVTASLADMRFSDATKRLYAFIWNDFCDWYLELVKTRLQSANAEEKRAVLQHALAILEGALRLLHPLMPFITEEIYQTLIQLSPNSLSQPTILYAPFPRVRKDAIDSAVEAEFVLLQEVVSALRTIRGELGVQSNRKITVGLTGGSDQQLDFLAGYSAFVQKLTGAEQLVIRAPKPKGSASSVVQGIEVYVPLGGLIDPVVERARLSKEFDRLGKLIAGADGRLANPQFVASAKPEIVDAERQKLADLRDAREKVARFLTEIEAMGGHS
ncbi:valine--tRNA ligase [candidate division KSB1 bacterium]|nr:valine--tRNA ligase [candidate division KSB1 bacterium]